MSVQLTFGDIDKLVDVYLKMCAAGPLYRAMTDLLEEHGRKIGDFKVNQRIRTTSGLAWVAKIDDKYVHYTYDSGYTGHNPPWCCIPLNEFKIREAKPGDRVTYSGKDWAEESYLVINDPNVVNELGLVWVKYGSVQCGINKAEINKRLQSGEFIYVN